MPPAIERYFGAELHGFKTYRYHEGCEKLRAWTAAPLCVGIGGRAVDTIHAMFSPRTWTGVDMLTEEATGLLPSGLFYYQEQGGTR